MDKQAAVADLTDLVGKFTAYIGKRLPTDVTQKLGELRTQEVNFLAKEVYESMRENQEQADKLNRPSCQDTGVIQYFLTAGAKFPLLGELEAAFVAAWAGHSLAALACWGDGVRLLLGCTDAVVGELAPVFAGALAMLRVQLGVSLGDGGGSSDAHAAPTLIDADALFEDAFLKRALRGFYEGLAEAGGGPPEVQVSGKGERARAQPTNADKKSSLVPFLPHNQRAADALRRLLADRLGWRVDVASLDAGGGGSDDDSDGPVVVEDAERGW